MAIHVHPAGDLITHEMNDGCPCGPSRELAEFRDGTALPVTLHYSLDGRENQGRPEGGSRAGLEPATPDPRPLPS